MLSGSNESRRRLRELEKWFEDEEWHAEQPLGGVVIMTRFTLAAEWKRMIDSLHDSHRPFVPSHLFPHVDASLCDALKKCYVANKGYGVRSVWLGKTLCWVCTWYGARGLS